LECRKAGQEEGSQREDQSFWLVVYLPFSARHVWWSDGAVSLSTAGNGEGPEKPNRAATSALFAFSSAI
jgi:hypothetical protein